MHSWNHGEILGVSYTGKKIKAEKGGRGIESNVIEEYTPLLYFSIVSVFVVAFVNNQYIISFIDTFVNLL